MYLCPGDAINRPSSNILATCVPSEVMSRIQLAIAGNGLYVINMNAGAHMRGCTRFFRHCSALVKCLCGHAFDSAVPWRLYNEYLIQG